MERSFSSVLKDVFRQMAGIDLRSLAVFRIGLALVLLWDLGVSISSARAFYSNDGFMPLASLEQFRESPWLWSIHTWSGSTAWQVALLVLNMAAAACMLVGCRAQLAAFVCWVLVGSLQIRNPTVLSSCDTVLRLLCFWAMLLPLGARWSVDAVRGRACASGRAAVIASWPSLAILIQVCHVYWMGAAMKNGDEWLRDGTAVYYALSLDQFVSTTGRELLRFPSLCRAFTFGTWWLEVIGPALAFLPYRIGLWRIGLVAVFWALHIGFWICLRLGPFPLTMMVAWLLFLPSEFWEFLRARLRPDSSPSANESIEPSCDRHWTTKPPAQIFGFICLVYVTLWNLRGVDFKRWGPLFPQWVNPFGYVLQLQQYWPMFAPRPTLDDGWVIMEAVLADGTRVDLLRDGQPVRFEKPELISAEFRDYKWQKVILNLWRSPYTKVRPLFTNYLSFEWNGSHPAPKQIKGWTLWYMREDTQPPGAPKIEAQKVEILRTGRS